MPEPNPFEKAAAATAVVDAPPPVVDKPVVDAPAKVEEPKPAAEVEGTLLGKEEKTAEEIAAETAVATKAAEEKAKVDAENKKLLEADEKTLTPEQLAKKQELVKEKAAADAKSKTVPEKYEVKAPEGMKVDQVFLDTKLAPVLKEHGVTQEALQKIIDVYAPHLQEQLKQGITAQQDDAINAWKDNVKAWKAETKEVYGTKLDSEMAYAAKAINKLSSDPKALRELLNDKPGTTGTGLGNNKLIAEMFIKAGKFLGEDTFPIGSKAAGEADTSDEAKAERMFGKKTA